MERIPLLEYSPDASPVPHAQTRLDMQRDISSVQLIQMRQASQDDLFTRLLDLTGQEDLVEDGVDLCGPLVSVGQPRTSERRRQGKWGQ
jgi:hypothetical protein